MKVRALGEPTRAPHSAVRDAAVSRLARRAVEPLLRRVKVVAGSWSRPTGEEVCVLTIMSARDVRARMSPALSAELGVRKSFAALLNVFLGIHQSCCCGRGLRLRRRSFRRRGGLGLARLGQGSSGAD